MQNHLWTQHRDQRDRVVVRRFVGELIEPDSRRSEVDGRRPDLFAVSVLGQAQHELPGVPGVPHNRLPR